MSPVRKPTRGRPRGAQSFDPNVAMAFGHVVRTERSLAGISQEALAHMANVERSYFGRMERGQSQPTLHVVLKVASALGFDGGTLVTMVEEALHTIGKKEPKHLLHRK